MHLRKEKDVIHGVVYEVLPANRNGLSKFATGVKEVLLFEGYGFRIDSIEWRLLMN
jgi:hypothetical protein